MTPQSSVQSELRGQSVLKGLLGAFARTRKQPENDTGIDALWQDMTAAGDSLIDALRLEREFRKIDFTEAEDGVLARWRANRGSVERMAGSYAGAVSKWRKAIQAECLRRNTRGNTGRAN